MKSLLVPWWLLIFGASLTSTHYIRQAEDSHSNVYEVRDSSSGVSFINPKPEKPTLREILYYHVIEQARDGKPVTERSFTNGHGYQFLEPETSEHDQTYKEKDGEYLHDHEDNGRYKPEENGEDDGLYRHEEHSDEGLDVNEHNENVGDDENEGHDENVGRDENEAHNENEELSDPGQLDDAEAILRELLTGLTGDEEDPESTTTREPLTDEDVKEAYKSRSYLFDQMRQRYAVKRMAKYISDHAYDTTPSSLGDTRYYAVPETLNRRKRQAVMDMEPVPEPPSLSSDPLKDAYMQPKTYGMNLNPEGGYVWNNLNKPPTYYELGNGNPNEGQYEPSQSQESIAPTNENAYAPPPPEPTNSGSSEDIYVNTNRPIAIPLENAPNPESSEPIYESPEPINENPEPINEYPAPVIENAGPVDPESNGANYPVAPVIADDENKPESDVGVANYPMGPEVYNEPSYTVIQENPPIQSDKPEEFEPQGSPSESPAEVGSYENPGTSYEAQPEEPKPESSLEESTGDKIKEMPEAPTLPPLNYDNLPSYIRDAISSTETPTSLEQTENPYFNPQPNSEDKKVMEDKIEDIFATMTPVDDIPKTYGMNLSSDGGHVWNEMVNPPVSYDVGTPVKPEEEHKEPALEPEPEKEAEIDEPIPKPEEPSIEPEPHESEEDKNPVEEPARPESEPEIEEPIAKPDEPNQEQPEPTEPELGEIEEPIADPNQEQPKPIPEPETPDNPMEQPNQPPEPLEPEPENPEHEDLPETEKPEDIEEPSEEIEQEVPAELKPEDEKKPDIMSELLKSEQFWKWLGEWTATYMDLLEKHIRKIAIQEICNREKSGTEMCLLDEKPDAGEDTGVVIKDGKIIVDGKEIDMTKTDNLDKDLKKGNHNQYHNKEGNGNKIQATTIYGNSVGNEHVTNVFIFSADKADEVVDKLKPENGSEINFVIDDRIKEDDKENTEKSIEDVTEDNENANKPVESESIGKEPIGSDSIEKEPIKIEANEDQLNKELDKDEESKGNNGDIETADDGKGAESEPKPILSETSESKEYLEK